MQLYSFIIRCLQLLLKEGLILSSQSLLEENSLGSLPFWPISKEAKDIGLLVGERGEGQMELSCKAEVKRGCSSLVEHMLHVQKVSVTGPA